MRFGDEGGTTAVELAILTPIVLTLLGSLIFIGDLGVARIRQREAARLLAWEFTAHALTDQAGGAHAASWEAARAQTVDAAMKRLGGRANLSRGMLASSSLGDISAKPIALQGGEKIERPPLPPGFGALLEPLGTLIQQVAGLQLPLLERYGFNVRQIGVLAEAGMVVEGSGLLPGLPKSLAPTPARIELRVDTWALHDGSDVPLPGKDTAMGRQVGRIALFGIGEKLRSQKAGAALSWIPFSLGAPVVSMNYGPPAADTSPVGCGGEDALARTGRWENGPQVGTVRDRTSPVRCFDTLPIDANGFGKGGGRQADPVWQQLVRRGSWEMGCDRPDAAFPGGCGKGAERWTRAASR